MTIHCKDCKYWAGKSETIIAQAKQLRACSCEKYLLGYNYTNPNNHGAMEEIADDSVIVENDEGWGFITGPMFGCVHAKRYNGQ